MSYLCDGLATGLDQSNCFLFEFSRVGFLNLCPGDPFPDLLEYISAFLTLPNRGMLNDVAIKLCERGHMLDDYTWQAPVAPVLFAGQSKHDLRAPMTLDPSFAYSFHLSLN